MDSRCIPQPHWIIHFHTVNSISYPDLKAIHLWFSLHSPGSLHKIFQNWSSQHLHFWWFRARLFHWRIHFRWLAHWSRVWETYKLFRFAEQGFWGIYTWRKGCIQSTPWSLQSRSFFWTALPASDRTGQPDLHRTCHYIDRQVIFSDLFAKANITLVQYRRVQDKICIYFRWNLHTHPFFSLKKFLKIDR